MQKAQCIESAKCGKIARLSLELGVNVHTPVNDSHNADYFVKNSVENEPSVLHARIL